MRRVSVFFVLAFVASLEIMCGQEALWSASSRLLSPEINSDNSVTFRYMAPEAKSVKVTGDFLPKSKLETEHGVLELPGFAELVKDDATGVWSFTTAPLMPELYLYNFLVDGVYRLDPLNLAVTRDIASFTNRLLVPGEESDAYNVNKIPHGTVHKTWYDSPTLGMERRITVYTPAGYETSGESYPVLYLLHGMGGDENAWLENGRLAEIMDYIINKGDAEPMIVVLPNGNPRMPMSPADDRLHTPIPTTDEYRVADGSYEASFPEIVGYIDCTYRTVADKMHRAIAGLSMGGFHTMQISKEFPDMFDYVGLFSAATPGRVRVDGIGLYSDLELKLQKQFGASPALYWIAIGRDDFLYENNVAYRAILDSARHCYEYVESEGGHTWRNWRNYLKIFASRLFKHVNL